MNNELHVPVFIDIAKKLRAEISYAENGLPVVDVWGTTKEYEEWRPKQTLEEKQLAKDMAEKRSFIKQLKLGSAIGLLFFFVWQLIGSNAGRGWEAIEQLVACLVIGGLLALFVVRDENLPLDENPPSGAEYDGKRSRETGQPVYRVRVVCYTLLKVSVVDNDRDGALWLLAEWFESKDQLTVEKNHKGRVLWVRLDNIERIERSDDKYRKAAVAVMRANMYRGAHNALLFFGDCVFEWDEKQLNSCINDMRNVFIDQRMVWSVGYYGGKSPTSLL